MTERVSVVILFGFGVFLIAVSLFALARPRRAIALIGKFASTSFINYSELTLRLLVGAAFLGASETVRNPRAFLLIGAVLIVSALALMLVPRRWHAGFAIFWSKRMPVAAIYLAAPASLMGGAALLLLLTRAF
jgi:hypothetical protein